MAKAGSLAICSLAISNSENKMKLVAAGVREELQAIVADSLSSTDANNAAKDAIGQLRQVYLGCGSDPAHLPERDAIGQLKQGLFGLW